jgi:hypothetical protein
MQFNDDRDFRTWLKFNRERWNRYSGLAKYIFFATAISLPAYLAFVELTQDSNFTQHLIEESRPYADSVSRFIPSIKIVPAYLASRGNAVWADVVQHSLFAGWIWMPFSIVVIMAIAYMSRDKQFPSAIWMDGRSDSWLIFVFSLTLFLGVQVLIYFGGATSFDIEEGFLTPIGLAMLFYCSVVCFLLALWSILSLIVRSIESKRLRRRPAESAREQEKLRRLWKSRT